MFLVAVFLVAVFLVAVFLVAVFLVALANMKGLKRKVMALNPFEIN